MNKLYRTILKLIKKRGVGFVELDFKSELAPKAIDERGPDGPKWRVDFCYGKNYLGYVHTSFPVTRESDNGLKTYWFSSYIKKVVTSYTSKWNL